MNRSPAAPTHRLSNGTGESTSCSISVGKRLSLRHGQSPSPGAAGESTGLVSAHMKTISARNTPSATLIQA